MKALRRLTHTITVKTLAAAYAVAVFLCFAGFFIYQMVMIASNFDDTLGVKIAGILFAILLWSAIILLITFTGAILVKMFCDLFDRSPGV